MIPPRPDLASWRPARAVRRAASGVERIIELPRAQALSYCKIIANAATIAHRENYSVALLADGNTARGPNDNNALGAAMTGAPRSKLGSS
jgi:hypothetical protein